MLNYDGVLFDLDGTLLDTAADLGHALNHVLKHHQQPLCSYQQYRLIASDGAMGLLNLGFKQRLEEIDVEQARQMLLDYYLQNICVDTRPFDGVESLLTRLNEQQIPWGIVTNKPYHLTMELLQHFPLMRDCHCIVGGDSLEHRKPHPLPLLHAAEKLGLTPRRTLYVGDALRDMQAAQQAGMPGVIAGYGYISPELDLDSWPAQYHIDHIQELCALN